MEKSFAGTPAKSDTDQTTIVVPAFLPSGTLMKANGTAATLATDEVYGVAGIEMTVDEATNGRLQEVITLGHAFAVNTPGGVGIVVKETGLSLIKVGIDGSETTITDGTLVKIL